LWAEVMVVSELNEDNQNIRTTGSLKTTAILRSKKTRESELRSLSADQSQLYEEAAMQKD
jgi:hypothetical protein